MGRSASYWPYLCVLPAVLLFIVFQAVPSLTTSIFSLTDYTGLPNTPIHYVGLENYTELFVGNRYYLVLALQATVIFAVLVTVVQNGLAVLVAWLLNGTVRGRIVVRSIVFLPVVLGATINGLVWYVMFNPLSGPVTLVLASMGIKANLLGSTATALYAVIFVQIWANLGFSMMIFLAGLQGISADVYEAGHIDGTSAWQAFRHITIPLLAPSITINVLLAAIGSMTTYELIFVLTDGGPAFTSQTLGMYVFNQAFYGSSTLPGYASAVAMVQFAIVFAVVLVMQYYLRRREAVL